DPGELALELDVLAVDVQGELHVSRMCEPAQRAVGGEPILGDDDPDPTGAGIGNRDRDAAVVQLQVGRELHRNTEMASLISHGSMLRAWRPAVFPFRRPSTRIRPSSRRRFVPSMDVVNKLEMPEVQNAV